MGERNYKDKKMKKVTVYVPGTVSNVGSGFDVMGFAMEGVGEEVEVIETNGSCITLRDESGYKLPLVPEKNTAAVAAESLRKRLGISQGFEIVFKSKIKPGSGLGSSAASAVAAVFGINALLGNPLSKNELIDNAMDGELIASGSRHADNVAPAMLGNFTLIRSTEPMDIVSIPSPELLYCTVIHPQIEVKTAEARNILPHQVPLSDAIHQWGNTAGLIAGLYTSDYALVGRSMQDYIIEQHRSKFIPGYALARKQAFAAGALGYSISGSGPSMFAFSTSERNAKVIAHDVISVFKQLNIPRQAYVGKIDNVGVCLRC